MVSALIYCVFLWYFVCDQITYSSKNFKPDIKITEWSRKKKLVNLEIQNTWFGYKINSWLYRDFIWYLSGHKTDSLGVCIICICHVYIMCGTWYWQSLISCSNLLGPLAKFEQLQLHFVYNNNSNMALSVHIWRYCAHARL